MMDIDKLEGRELNVYVATTVMDWNLVHRLTNESPVTSDDYREAYNTDLWLWDTGEGRRPAREWNPSCNMADALQAADKLGMSDDSLSPLAISRAALKEARLRIELDMPYGLFPIFVFPVFGICWAALKGIIWQSIKRATV